MGSNVQTYRARNGLRDESTHGLRTDFLEFRIQLGSQTGHVVLVCFFVLLPAVLKAGRDVRCIFCEERSEGIPTYCMSAHAQGTKGDTVIRRLPCDEPRPLRLGCGKFEEILTS